MISRRGLITGLVSLVAAPAVVRAQSLMPVVFVPKGYLLCDGRTVKARHYPELAKLMKELPDTVVYGFDQILSAAQGTLPRNIHFNLFVKAIPSETGFPMPDGSIWKKPVGALFHTADRNVDFG